MAVVDTRLLDSLPARPPTPPRETSHDVDASIKQTLLSAHSLSLDARASLQTPPSAHPLLSAVSTNDSTDSARRKRVEFSTHAQYSDPPVYPVDANHFSGPRGQTTPLAILPTSGTDPRPVKSILKATTYETLPSTPVNIADMLASTVQQLVGADRDSKLDAYVMLARALKASDNLPDRIALQSKMPLLTQLIQRDILASRATDGTLDSTLVISALDLLCTFLHFSAIASSLPHDFAVFIVDYCIRSLEQATAPRDMLRTLLRVIYTQNFSAKVMTVDRVGRLVLALHAIDEHYDSKNIIVMRCLNYRTLVKNQPMMMATHVDWLQDVLVDMVSSVPHIRDAAISLGLDAAFAIGRERSTSHRVAELLQATVDGMRYLDYYANRLQAMTKNKTDSHVVPQVWSVVTLFLRNLEKWDFYMDWLRILQACFNSSDYRTKEEANIAWSRFTYSLLRDNRPLSKRAAKTLTVALVSQLRRRGSGKQSDDLRRAVLGCVCSICYYTVRDVAQLDNIWDNILSPVVSLLVDMSNADDTSREKRKASLVSATAILTSLVNCSTPKIWKEDLIAKNPLVAPEDLPSIDAKWIRRNAERVFSLVGPILDHNYLDLAIPRSATQVLWRSVVGAVATAAAKEVKVAPEMAVFVGHAFSFLLKRWTIGVPTQLPTQTVPSNDGADKPYAESQFLAATREYILTMVDSLGPLPFTEKQLTKDESNAFVPAATPSHRTGKGRVISRTAIRHLFSILTFLPPGVQDNDDFAEFVETIFAPFFSSKSGAGRRILASDLLQMSPVDALCPFGPWQAMAYQITTSLTSAPITAAAGSGHLAKESAAALGNGLNTSYQNPHASLSPGISSNDAALPGHEFREIVRVLERGLRSTPRLPWLRWQSLFCTLCERVRAEAGDAGLAICVLDPLAKAVSDMLANPLHSTLSATARRAIPELISLASHPRSRQAVDAAKRRLWGSVISTSGPSAPFDPYDHLYKLINTTLQIGYTGYDVQDQSSVDLGVSVLKETAGFFSRSNDQLFLTALVSFQDGIALWVRDGDAKLGRQSPSTDAVLLVWNAICPILERVNKQIALPLDVLDVLLSAAFSSKHRAIVNRALLLWNEAYGDHVGSMNYPDQLKAALLSLQPLVDVAIPGFGATHVESGGAQQPMFVDSQENFEPFVVSPISGIYESVTPCLAPNKQHPKPLSSPSAMPTASALNRAASPVSKTQADGETKCDKTKSALPRPRHDDSQSEFTTIDPVVLMSGSLGLPAEGIDCIHTASADAGGSQVLTERQREVRYRQRGTTTMYPSITSSSPSRQAAGRTFTARPVALSNTISSLPPAAELDQQDQHQPPSSPGQEDIALPEQPRATTPEPLATAVKEAKGEAAGFVENEFIASTPTPRRGQTLLFLPVVNDNENDPPSSPPEPRRYPLLPEISSRPRSSNMLDEWQFSSSPPTGSPISACHTAPEPDLSLTDAVTTRLQGPENAKGLQDDDRQNEVDVVPTHAGQENAVANTGVAMEDAPYATSFDTALKTKLVAELPIAVNKGRKNKTPSTPKRTRFRTMRARETSTPQNSQEEPALASQNGSFSAVPRSLPRELSTPWTVTSHAYTQSSPVRRSLRDPRLKLMAILPPSKGDQSLTMAKDDEQSMSLIENNTQTRSVLEAQAACGVPVDDEHSEAHGCIAVQTQSKSNATAMSDGASVYSPLERTSPSTPSRRLRRRKRKRSFPSPKGDADLKSPTPASQPDRPIVQPSSRRSKSNTPVSDDAPRAQAAVVSGVAEVTEVAKIAEAADTAPPVDDQHAWADDAIVMPEATTEDQEVQSQLVMESQVLGSKSSEEPIFAGEEVSTGEEHTFGTTQEVVGLATGTNMEAVSEVAAKEDVAAAVQEVAVNAIADTVAEGAIASGRDDADEGCRPTKKAKLTGILSVLKDGLKLLQSASLSREEVNEIEDVCMDVKRALYSAELRGRG